MFASVISCLCMRMRVVWSSSVSSCGSCASVCAVVFVKGKSLCIRVIRPPPPPCCLSSLSVVKPGNFGVLCEC